MTETPPMPELPQSQRIALVTGPSGAGRSTAIHALEDMGFEAIDNLPLTLLPRLLDGRPLARPLALGIDVRNRDFSVPGFGAAIERLAGEAAYDAALLYLDCRADVLLRRFSETRRRHPFAADELPAEAVERELAMMAPLRERADILVDTSELTPHELRAALGRWFGSAESPGLGISIHSFSFRRGLPQELDTVFDVRFLANPHWVRELRALDGRDPRVAAHVAQDPRFEAFFSRMRDLVISLLPAYLAEGKTHFAIGFGCTGGRHRSVAVTETLAKALAEAGWQVSIRHRELERQDRAAGSA